MLSWMERRGNLCGMRVMSWLVGYLEMPLPGTILLEAWSCRIEPMGGWWFPPQQKSINWGRFSDFYLQNSLYERLIFSLSKETATVDESDFVEFV